MNIAIFTDTYLPEINGVSISVFQLANELSKNNKVIVFCPKYPKGNNKGKGEFKIVRIKSVPLPIYKTLRFSLPNLLSIYKTLKKFKPDITHFHSPGPLGIACLIISKYLKIPVIATYHTLYNELIFYVSPIEKIKKLLSEKILENLWSTQKPVKKFTFVWKKIWKNNRKKESRLEKITWKAIKEFHASCNKIIIPSPFVKKLMDKKGLKGKTINIFNGVDIFKKFPAKKDYSLKNNILFVGRLAEEKRLDLLIKSFYLAKKVLPNLILTISGDGPEMERLKKLTAKLNIENSVKFLGMVPQEKLTQIYHNSDIFVITSKTENQPLVVLEAMASGLPIIGVKKHGLTDLIDNSVNGYLLDPKNIKLLSKYIIKLIKNQKLREKLGKNSRRKAKDYDIQKTASKTFDLYKSIIQKKTN